MNRRRERRDARTKGDRTSWLLWLVGIGLGTVLVFGIAFLFQGALA